MLNITKQHIYNLHSKVKAHWRKVLVFGIGGLLVLNIIGQVLYPSDRLPLFTVIDGISMSGWKKTDAIKRLDNDYLNKTIPIYFGQTKKAYDYPKPGVIGITVKNESRISDINYPWYLRIVPTSVFWANRMVGANTKPIYTHDDKILSTYIENKLGKTCNVKPQDASLKVSGSVFEVVPSQTGGICDVNEVHRLLSVITPSLTGDNHVTLPVKEISPNITDDAAKKFGDYLLKKIGSGVTVFAGNSSQIIPFSQLISWIDFNVSDSQLTYSFNADRASNYLTQEFASKVAVTPGTTTINTYNFVEVSRVTGANGKGLDVNATLNDLKSFIDGDYERAIVATMPTPPQIAYSRSYSSNDTGLSALIQQFAQSHPGVFGVSMVELSGQNRRASYNDSRSFVTASTYKLFVAYSTLKRVESGLWHWDDVATSSKNLAVCFDDMIVKSDNDCGATLLAKVGYTNITNDAHSIGCNGTSFLGKENIVTTTADLTNLLAQLQTGQMLSQQSSRDRLIDAMKRNIYRQGIPAGIGGSVVADKVGFMDNLLHDASIVYSPTGTYILVIMTDGSSWSTIADLAKQIEALRTQ